MGQRLLFHGEGEEQTEAEASGGSEGGIWRRGAEKHNEGWMGAKGVAEARLRLTCGPADSTLQSTLAAFGCGVTRREGVISVIDADGARMQVLDVWTNSPREPRDAAWAGGGRAL